jgi:cytoskeletal protein CcmA (bactofilin family)
MRTDAMGPGALLLALLLAASPGSPAAAQEAAETGASPAGRVVTGDRTVEAGAEVEDIVVVGGHLRVLGTVRGDAVVVGGDLILEESGSVLGDAVVTGGRIVDQGGRILGEMRTLDAAAGTAARSARRAAAEGATAAQTGRQAARAAREAAREGRNAQIGREVRETRRSGRSWFDPIQRGLAGVISTLALGVVLGGIGALLIFYARPYLETVSDTIRGSTLRSGGVGLAASFLVFPAFVVLIVALAVSIIGIPVLLLAVPLYPLAVTAAATFGLLAAAHAIGERTADQRRDGLDLRYRNSYAYLFTGLGMLLAPLLAAYLVGMTGFLGFIGTLIRVVTWTVIWAAATVGFGAVILSRAGTRRTFVAPPPEVEFDDDTLFGRESAARRPHV